MFLEKGREGEISRRQLNGWMEEGRIDRGMDPRMGGRTGGRKDG